MSEKSLGPALRYLKEGPVEILTRMMDFNIQTFKSKDQQEHVIPASTLVAFEAVSFRELPKEAHEDGSAPSDRWEFTVTQDANGAKIRAMIYIHGTDIFMVRAISKVL